MCACGLHACVLLHVLSTFKKPWEKMLRAFDTDGVYRPNFSISSKYRARIFNVVKTSKHVWEECDISMRTCTVMGIQKVLECVWGLRFKCHTRACARATQRDFDIDERLVVNYIHLHMHIYIYIHTYTHTGFAAQKAGNDRGRDCRFYEGMYV